MTNAQSKVLQKTVTVTCKEFNHPWTNHCVNASAGLLLAATPYCIRVYTVVYALSLLMRHRIPTWLDIKRTLYGILQSTAFLVTNSFTFVLYNCLLRNILGFYHTATVAFIPSFMASLTAILVERPARRPLLALYVANVATEAFWNLLVARGYAKTLPQGQTVIFALGITILLYMYRLGLHKNKCKDSIFNIIRTFLDGQEEGPLKKQNIDTLNNNNNVQSTANSRLLNLRHISSYVQLYQQFMRRLKGRHESCLHKDTCVIYSLRGGLKPFLGGISLQIMLKITLNVQKILSGNMKWSQQIFNRKTLRMGAFLGGFSFLYKSLSCLLRHTFGYDDPRFSIPAGLLASTTFSLYPDNTVALYVFWKMLQIVYNYGAEMGVLPVIPGFILILYSFCTAVLFHSGILEPKTLRPSYFKFLQAISGERLSKFNTKPFEAFGFNAKQSMAEVMQNLNMIDNTILPKFALVS